MAKAVTHDPAAPAIQLHFGSVFFLFLFFFPSLAPGPGPGRGPGPRPGPGPVLMC